MHVSSRFVDIRTKLSGSELKIYHGISYQRTNLHAVISDTLDFLNAHPSETILMSIKDENDDTDANSYLSVLNEHLNTIPSNRKLITTSVPTLSQARGRIVVIDRFPGSIGAMIWGASYMDIQDDYSVPTLFHRDDKWHKVRDQLDQAKNDGNKNKLYINFCSGSSAGAYPNDVADYVNWRVQDHLESPGPHYRWGIVIFDFPNIRDIEAVFYSSYYPQALANTLQYQADPPSK